MPPHAIALVDPVSVWDLRLSCSSLESFKEKPVVEVPCPAAEQRKVKTVAFCNEATLHEVPHSSDMTEDEIRIIWYNEEDYDRIKEEWNETIKKHAKGEPIVEDEGHCMRGLEARTKFGARRRKSNRANALNAIWETQVAQWKQKMDDQAAIAAAYKPHSLHCKYPALEAAYRDEVFVKEQVKKSVNSTIYNISTSSQ